MKIISLIIFMTLLVGCSTSTTIDEYRANDGNIELGEDEKVVVLGRRHAGRYETEPDFINCIGDKMGNGGSISVLDETRFINSLYPWFEPRTAPLKLSRMKYMMSEPLLRDSIQRTGVRYMIWVDGTTETLERGGSISCAVGPGGGGCFGFATWDKGSSYEATIWDLKEMDSEGQVRVDANGTSYMIAVGAPIPFIARVQAQACEGIAKQLREFFEQEPEEP